MKAHHVVMGNISLSLRRGKLLVFIRQKKNNNKNEKIYGTTEVSVRSRGTVMNQNGPAMDW